MNKQLILFLGLCFVVILIIMHRNHTIWLNDIKSNHTLTCYIDGEYKDIDPAKIVDFEDTTGYWVFTNGSAKNCELN